MKLPNQYRPWLFGFIFVNVIAAILMYYEQELIGDLRGNKLGEPSHLWIALSLIVLSYIILLYPVYSFLLKIKIHQVKFKQSEKVLGQRIGVAIFCLQILFFAFNSFYGVNTAGSNNTTADTPLALLWVIIPADTLFVLYYAFYRDNKYFKMNLFFWLLSNLIRGWAGIFLFVIFFEWCRVYRRGGVSLFKVVVVGAVILFLYPILSIFKWLMRASAGSSIDFQKIIAEVSHNLNGQDYFELVQFGIEHIIGRIQLTSILVEVINLKDRLQTHFISGDFQPFWMEGLHGIFIERLFLGYKSNNIGVAFTEYANFGWAFDVGDWNINVSLPAWFFISPYLSVFYLIYIFLLCFFSVLLIKLIGETDESKDLVWLTWLVYLLPLWLGTFVAFIYALIVFLVLKLVLSNVPILKLRRNK
ncbi:oligosaccharide repeat unit polymerase [Shewanella glacialipiscicola]|uniref:oligosaccharide repeat unit polymerase n=1 Tax=Shewanella glacialipiscicola TaxID=614069 RepID=UPI0021DB0A1F|nr:oligosaccharide repeat unit polymerase [Shewanella glacialipiscicola]MCU7995605.1 oligosaccharide repeat unit polymerase [Shewanella glacialipiscicola]MCU8026852.1 oligosaccharide repeat unit polymerase [Shewanella glacialipiscicola]